MSFPKKKTRNSVFKRLRGIQLNPRDIAILADLGDFYVLDTKLCHERHFPNASYEWCRQTLVRLRRAGFVRSIKLQVAYAEDFSAKGGRMPAYYFLTDEGATAVQRSIGIRPMRVLRSDPSPFTLFHRLQVARVRAAFDSAIQATPLDRPEWILEQDVRPDASDDLMPNQRRWLYHAFRHPRGVVTCQPDAAALLRIPNPGQPEPTYLVAFFEIDRSTEGLEQIMRKLPGYESLLKRRTLPYWPNLRNMTIRVFWIVPSKQRINEIVAAIHQFEIAKTFRFTTFKNCDASVLTHPVWTTICGETKAIYTPLPSDT